MLSLNNRITTLETPSVVAFKAVSDVFDDYLFNTGTVAPFNVLSFCVPDATRYNTAECSYTVPVEGIYQFTIKTHNDIPPNAAIDLALYKNGLVFSLVRVFGQIITVVTDHCMVGDVYQVKMPSTGESGVVLRMSQFRAHFEGHLIK